MGRRAAPSRNERQNDAAHAGLVNHSEDTWQAMTDVQADETDRWNDVEEHLLRNQDHDVKRWKYFAK